MATTKFKPNKKRGNDGIDSLMSNSKKALGAETALRAYAKLGPKEPIEDHHIEDFLADIRHLCHRDGRDFEELLESARGHYIAER